MNENVIIDKQGIADRKFFMKNIYSPKLRDIIYLDIYKSKVVTSTYNNKIFYKLYNIPTEEYDIRNTNKYSMLNFVDTSASVFDIIFDYFNSKIENKEIETTIKKYNNDQEIFTIDTLLEYNMNGFEKMLSLIVHYKLDLFRKNTEIFKKIIQKCNNQVNKSDLSENRMTQRIRAVLSQYEGFSDFKKVGGYGEPNDMFMGSDIEFNYNGRICRVQHKLCRNIIKEDGYYIMGNIKHNRIYYIDYMSFEDADKNMYLFENKKVDSSSNDSYKISEDCLIIENYTLHKSDKLIKKVQ